jgi:hypothetical protein
VTEGLTGFEVRTGLRYARPGRFQTPDSVRETKTQP